MTTQTEARTLIEQALPAGYRLLELRFFRTGTHLQAEYSYSPTTGATIANCQKGSRSFPL